MIKLSKKKKIISLILYVFSEFLEIFLLFILAEELEITQLIIEALEDLEKQVFRSLEEVARLRVLEVLRVEACLDFLQDHLPLFLGTLNSVSHVFKLKLKLVSLVLDIDELVLQIFDEIILDLQLVVEFLLDLLE